MGTVCTLIWNKILCEFGYKKFAGKISCNCIGTNIGIPMYSGNNFFENSGHLKFSHTENSQENAGLILLK